VRDKLAVIKQGACRCHMEKFNLKKLNVLEGKEIYSVEVSNRFVALGNLNAAVKIVSTCETIRENIIISAKESVSY
jgi:hypothetical protein